ncbi:MAG: MarC family protein [Bdellovibrionota bacterium]
MEELLYSFIGVFVAMDIIGILPMYLNITRGMDKARRKRVLRQSIIIAGSVAIAFLLVGQWIFKFMGIELHDFMVGGGVVLLVMAILDLIHSKKSEDHSGSTGVVPLALPLITGPGLITTVMLQVTLYGNGIVALGLVLNFFFAWFALSKSDLITKLIGKEGTDIASKLAALFLTAIAFSMIRRGVYEAIKAVQ